MVTANKIFRRIFGKRDVIAERKRRVAELERDPKVMAAVLEGIESERRGEGVRFEDLKRRDA